MGPEFCKDIRKTAVTVRALNGLKSARAAFKCHLARCTESMEYKPYKADTDLWLKPEIKPEDGVQYYLYLLCYVDDILYIHHNANDMLEWLHQFFPHVPKFDKPDIYLGALLNLQRKAENPFQMGHYSELDTSPELEPDAVSYYLTISNI